MTMINLVTPIDFDKISDDILYLGNNMILRMNVVLARMNNKDRSRIFYHKEFMYDAKYSDKTSVGTLRRSFQYFLSIDKTDLYISNVIIRPQDMILLISKLGEASKWFNGTVFGMKKGKIVIHNKPESIIVNGLCEGKFIMFDPIVIDYDDGNQTQGVRLTVSTTDNYTDLSADRFFGLYYALKNINMFQSAQLMLNYLGRPELGQLCTDYSGMGDDNYEPEISNYKKRSIANKGNRVSYFDRINNEGEEE